MSLKLNLFNDHPQYQQYLIIITKINSIKFILYILQKEINKIKKIMTIFFLIMNNLIKFRSTLVINPLVVMVVTKTKTIE